MFPEGWLISFAHAFGSGHLEEANSDLPAATEGVTFGHPRLRIEGKMFAVLKEYKGELGICVKVGTLLQGRFLRARLYIGKHEDR
jgi:hypothetical protein